MERIEPPFVRNSVAERHAFISDSGTSDDCNATASSCVGYYL